MATLNVGLYQNLLLKEVVVMISHFFCYTKLVEKNLVLLVITVGVGGVVLVLFYYYIKIIRASRKGYKVGQSQQFCNKICNFVGLTDQIRISVEVDFVRSSGIF